MMSYGGFGNNRQPAVEGNLIIDPAAWYKEDFLKNRKWIYELGQSESDELIKAIDKFVHNDKDLMMLKRSDFQLEYLAPLLANIRDELLYGRGFIVLRGWPIKKFGKRASALALWAIGQYLGDGALSQNKHGHVLGHVTDLGETRNDPTQRGPYSSEEIPFHVDCCDIVGLLCLETSQYGGESSLVSSITVHNEMLKRRPDLVKILYEPLYRDRRDEIPPGMRPWYRLAVFHVHKGYFSASIEPTYIGSAHRFKEVPEMTPLQKEAVGMVQALSEELRFDTGFKRGDIQFCNNHVIFHTRRAYQDHPNSQKKRHLLRLWLKALDGRPLPAPFYERHGDIDTIDRPGGIIGQNPVLSAPI